MSPAEQFRRDVAWHAASALGVDVRYLETSRGALYRVTRRIDGDDYFVDIYADDVGLERHEHAAQSVLGAALWARGGEAEQVERDLTWERCVASTATACVILPLHRLESSR
jgi:hypothetical protein